MTVVFCKPDSKIYMSSAELHLRTGRGYEKIEEECRAGAYGETVSCAGLLWLERERVEHHLAELGVRWK